ncbi:hypothetical protein AVEN_204891-1 [Araneus ventricosus]|uniref:Uncharacterized protein n=1 Tax=Araneus ventricosus TaxID=182803 RepID=A0A4Y2UF97_ARAVE|nr:hypothetical protein AVEN_204891-1 [Araneus ventricosus]
MSKEGVNNQVANLEQDMCNICSCNLNETSFVSCYSCSMNIHITCCQNIASTYEDNNFVYRCYICDRKENTNGASKSTRRPEKSSGKMIETCGKKMISVAVGDFILLNVPKVDRGPLDCPNLRGKFLKVEKNVYQIGTKCGIIKSWFPRCDFQTSGPQILEDVPENLFVKL